MAKSEANVKYNNSHAGTETHMAVDDKIKQGHTPEAMREGYGAASGVRPGAAESGGRLEKTETGDDPRTPERKSNHLENENAGLADS
jgi:hypothetical protein